jgi:hypothetical protein
LSCEADGNRSQLARKKFEEDCKHESDLTMAGEMIGRVNFFLASQIVFWLLVKFLLKAHFERE